MLHHLARRRRFEAHDAVDEHRRVEMRFVEAVERRLRAAAAASSRRDPGDRDWRRGARSRDRRAPSAPRGSRLCASARSVRRRRCQRRGRVSGSRQSPVSAETSSPFDSCSFASRRHSGPRPSCVGDNPFSPSWAKNAAQSASTDAGSSCQRAYSASMKPALVPKRNEVCFEQIVLGAAEQGLGFVGFGIHGARVLGSILARRGGDARISASRAPMHVNSQPKYKASPRLIWGQRRADFHAGWDALISPAARRPSWCRARRDSAKRGCPPISWPRSSTARRPCRPK